MSCIQWAFRLTLARRSRSIAFWSVAVMFVRVQIVYTPNCNLYHNLYPSCLSLLPSLHVFINVFLPRLNTAVPAARLPKCRKMQQCRRSRDGTARPLLFALQIGACHVASFSSGPHVFLSRSSRQRSIEAPASWVAHGSDTGLNTALLGLTIGEWCEWMFAGPLGGRGRVRLPFRFLFYLLSLVDASAFD